MSSLGWSHWSNVVGLRADEPVRVERTQQPRKDRWTVATPLADAGVTVRDVAEFWRAQPFDLGLAGKWEGNCDGCFLKSRASILRMHADHPERMGWWADMEAVPRGTSRRGRTFRADRETYGVLADLVRDMPRLPFDEGLVEGLDGCAGGCGT